MTGRTYVLIFFFWSVLAIVTPTLVLLSENSKPAAELFDEKNGGIVSRKVMGLTRKSQTLKVLAEQQNAPAAKIPTPEKAPVPAPAPSLAVSVRRFIAGAREVILATLNGLKQA